MRLSDFLTKKEKPDPVAITRAVDMTSEELVKEMRMDTARAMEKIDEIPKETVEELRPFFHKDFFPKSEEA